MVGPTIEKAQRCIFEVQQQKMEHKHFHGEPHLRRELQQRLSTISQRQRSLTGIMRHKPKDLQNQHAGRNEEHQANGVRHIDWLHMPSPNQAGSWGLYCPNGG